MNKYRVLIIDDERLIREGLRHYIDWNALDAEVVDICADGMEGLRAIEALHPHIVLTDISMPNMDGIALLKRVRETGENCEFILISSYSEFRYAQEALKYDAFDYILKPIEPDALFTCVSRCIQKIETAHTSATGVKLSAQMMAELLRNTLTGVPAAEQSMQNMLRMTGRSLDGCALLVLAQTQPTADMNVPTVLTSALSSRVTVCLCGGEDVARALAADLPERCYRVITPATELNRRFYAALYDLWREECRPEPGDAATPQGAAAAPDEESLRRQVRQSLSVIGSQQQRLLTTRGPVYEYFRAYYHYLEEKYHSPLPGVPSLESCLEELARVNNLYDLLKTAETLAADLSDRLHAQPAYNAYVRKAISLIEENYGSAELTLGSASSQLNVSPSYFSTIFKANTGHSFSDYLFRYRMGIARELLVRGEHKVYEISAMVGYPDVVQFSKRFKQFHGVSPREMLGRCRE